MLIYRVVPTGVAESGTSMVLVLLPQIGVGVGLCVEFTSGKSRRM